MNQMRATTVAAAHLLALLVSAPRLVAQERADAEQEGSFIPVAEQYEVLSSDAAYCGPRILYFFARHAGRECTLEEVVGLCGTAPDGTTDLVSLSRAAEALDLDPLLIQCRADQLLDLGGPAIFCVVRNRSPQKEGGDGELVVHYVGFVRPEGDAYRVVDPSLLIGDLRMSEAEVQRSFTGHALLLRGCPRPVVRPAWMTWRNVLGAAVAVSLAGAAVTIVARRKIRRKGAAPRAHTIPKPAS
jgi:hypothetical protein